MTNVYARKHGNSFLLKAEGHAVGAPEVCAAVSGLLYALAGYIENRPDSVEDVHIKLESADAEFRFRGSDAAEAVFLSTVIGLAQLAEARSAFISVDYREI